MKVPVSGKIIDAREKELMHQAVDDGWLTTGHFNDEFESALKQFIGVKHVLTCNSGSSANLLAFSALTSERLGERRIRPGDEVITIAAGFPTTINPIIQTGCIPVFCDVTIPEYNIDVTHLRQALSSSTRAVVLAHTLGTPFNVSAVKEFCNEYNLWLIEDCCDALGSTIRSRHVGTFGDIGTLSFYPAHHITTGEGGGVFTNSAKLARILESFRDWGRDCFCAPGCDNTCKNRFNQNHGYLPSGYDHKYTYSELGYNLKPNDIAAACGVAQMERLPGLVATRRSNYLHLRNGLECLEDHIILPVADVTSPFGFPITLRQGGRADVIKHLEERGIGTRLLFGGNLTKQPYMKNREYRIPCGLNNTDIIMNDTFWIGCWPGLNTDQINHSVVTLKDFFK